MDLTIRRIFNLIKRKAPFVSFLMLFLFPILKFDITSKLIIICVVITLLCNFKLIKEKYSLFGIKPMLNLSLWFFIPLLTLVNSDFIVEDLKVIKDFLPFIIIPFILFYLRNKPFSKKEKYLIYKVFVTVNIIYVLYAYFYLHNRFYPSYLLENKTFIFLDYIKYIYSYHHLLYDNRIEIGFDLFYHKLYNSSFLVVSILLIFELIKEYKSKLLRVLLISTALIMYVVILLMMSVPVIAALHFILLFYFCNIFLAIKKALLLTLTIISSLIIGYCQLNTQTINKNIEEGISSRLLIYKCAKTMMIEKPFFGFGFTEQQEGLNVCYDKIEMETENYYKKEKLNTHNFYLFLILSGGLILCFVFLMMLYISFNLSIKSEAVYYFCFLTLITLLLFVENYLERMYGVFLFTLFNTLWYRELWDIDKKDIIL